MNQTRAKSNKPRKQEVRDLMQAWAVDPTWELSTTPGYEEYASELSAFETRFWEGQKREKDHLFATRANELGCSIPLASYIEALESRLNVMEERLSHLENPNR